MNKSRNEIKICESTAIILFFPVILISFALFATKQEYLFSLPGSWVESRQYFIQIFSKPLQQSKQFENVNL